MNVVLDLLQQPWMVEAAGIDFVALQRALVETAQEQFRKLLKRRHLDQSRVNTHIIVGQPDIEIVRFAGEHGADLIAMGTHGTGV